MYKLVDRLHARQLDTISRLIVEADKLQGATRS